MLTSQQRYQSIQGLLMGLAIAEALALPPRRIALGKGIFRRSQPRYRLWPGRGLYGVSTQLAIVAGQAILQSRSTSEKFHEVFRSRLRWYASSLPPGLSLSTSLAGLRCWLSFLPLPTGSPGFGNSPATRSILLGVVLHNTGHRYQVWARDSAAITHNNPLVTDAAAVLAVTAQLAAISAGNRLNKSAALEAIIKSSKVDELRIALAMLKPYMDRATSPRKVADKLNMRVQSKHILPTTVMAIYCFLHFEKSYLRAVRSALLLAGQNVMLVATVGGLMGAHLGVQHLPEHLHDTLDDWPHDRAWMESLATRLSDWPHGVDDLLTAPPQPTYAVGQLMRNLSRRGLLLGHRLAGLFLR